MRYFLYNIRTKKSLYFSSRSEMNKWIRSHFRLMSYRQMCAWTVHRDSGRVSLAFSSGSFELIWKSCICDLPKYILSHLRID